MFQNMSPVWLWPHHLYWTQSDTEYKWPATGPAALSSADGLPLLMRITFYLCRKIKGRLWLIKQFIETINLLSICITLLCLLNWYKSIMDFTFLPGELNQIMELFPYLTVPVLSMEISELDDLINGKVLLSSPPVSPLYQFNWSS